MVAVLWKIWRPLSHHRLLSYSRHHCRRLPAKRAKKKLKQKENIAADGGSVCQLDPSTRLVAHAGSSLQLVLIHRQFWNYMGRWCDGAKVCGRSEFKIFILDLLFEKTIQKRANKDIASHSIPKKTLWWREEFTMNSWSLQNVSEPIPDLRSARLHCLLLAPGT